MQGNFMISVDPFETFEYTKQDMNSKYKTPKASEPFHNKIDAFLELDNEDGKPSIYMQLAMQIESLAVKVLHRGYFRKLICNYSFKKISSPNVLYKIDQENSGSDRTREDPSLEVMVIILLVLIR